MTFVNVDDTSSLFNYKDNAWSLGGISGEFDSTHHSTSTAGAQVSFVPFTGKYTLECLYVEATVKTIFIAIIQQSQAPR